MNRFNGEDHKAGDGAPPSYEVATSEGQRHRVITNGAHITYPLPVAGGISYSNSALHPDDMPDDEITPITSYAVSVAEPNGGIFPRTKREHFRHIRRKPVPSLQPGARGSTAELNLLEKGGDEGDEAPVACCASLWCCAGAPVCCRLSVRGIIFLVLLALIVIIGGCVGAKVRHDSFAGGSYPYNPGYSDTPTVYSTGSYALPTGAPANPQQGTSVSTGIWASKASGLKRRALGNRYLSDPIDHFGLFYQDEEGYIVLSIADYEFSNKTLGQRLVQARPFTPISALLYTVKGGQDMLRVFYVNCDDILSDIERNLSNKSSVWEMGELANIGVKVDQDSQIASVACKYPGSGNDGFPSTPMVWIQRDDDVVDLVQGNQRPQLANDWRVNGTPFGVAMPGTGLGALCLPQRENFHVQLWDMQQDTNVTILLQWRGPTSDTVNVSFAPPSAATTTRATATTASLVSQDSTSSSSYDRPSPTSTTSSVPTNLSPLSNSPLIPVVTQPDQELDSRTHLYYVSASSGNITVATSTNTTLFADNNGAWNHPKIITYPAQVDRYRPRFTVIQYADDATVFWQDANANGTLKAARIELSGKWTDLGVVIEGQRNITRTIGSR